jgi:uncharacterized protein DUF6869
VAAELEEADEVLADAYLKCLLEGADGEHSDAYADVLEAVSKDPERAWRLTLRMTTLAQGDSLLLATVAAGPLEDLLCWHGPVIIDRVEAQAAVDPIFLKCLASVYTHVRMPATIRARVRALTGEKG